MLRIITKASTTGTNFNRHTGTRWDQERQRDIEKVHDDDEGHAA
jgi:hypothetical protein